MLEYNLVLLGCHFSFGLTYPTEDAKYLQSSTSYKIFMKSEFF
jgi:hypothetical protein